MSTIKPFRALRPAADKVEHVVSHAVERYTTDTIKNKLATNPFSFLQVIFSGRNYKGVYPEQLKAIKSKFEEFISTSVLQQETEPCFYIYKQVKDGRTHIGIIALASVKDYRQGIIKIHEQTLAEREEKLKEYLSICNFNAEPVCLTHPFNKELHDFLYSKTKNTPLYNFTYDNISHTVWQIADKSDVATISAFFNEIPYLYIADGHHRAASSALLAESMAKNNPTHTGNEPYNFFMSAFFADNELTIYNFDRMVSSIGNHTPSSLLEELKKYFNVVPKGKTHCKPASVGEISMYLEKEWYLLQLKSGLLKNIDAVSILDVSILSDYILAPILGITDLRNDKRIAFIPGVRGLEEITEKVNSGKMKAAFCLYPISFSQLKAVADTGKEMPPKSTWIEPKLESGLLIYSLDN